jgi:ribonuclease HI
LLPYICALFEEKLNEHRNAYIFTDNQAAIQAVDSAKCQSGQYIVERILNTIDRIHEAKPSGTIHIEWVPGHKDIEGNEQTDQAAKTAASPNATLPTIRMKSAQNRSIKTTANAHWGTEWRNSRKIARRLRKHQPAPWH